MDDPYSCHVLTIGGDGKMRTMAEIETDVIRKAIAHTRGNIKQAARQLGIGRSTLYRKIEKMETMRQ